MMRIVATVALLVAAAQGASVPSPSFRFSYNEGDNPRGGVGQFYNGPDSAFIYNWGYQFPGHSHSESKTYDGLVQGSYAFVDANGDVQQTRYSAGGLQGFNVEQALLARSGIAEVFPTGPEPVPVPAPFIQQGEDDQQDFYSALASQGIGLDIGSKQAIEQASPTLLAAVRSGALVPLRGTGNELVFRVTDKLVNEARGSVSTLATLLDADPVAARHDQQVRRTEASFYSAPRANESADRAILETEYFDDGPSYIVRVPYKN